MKKSLFILCCLILFGACTKEEITFRPYPRVVTGNVSGITSTGAIFHGEITFSETEILDHGFIWSDLAYPDFDKSDRLSLGARSGIGKFDAQASTGLATGVKYYVRAYAKSDKYLVYGDTVALKLH